MLVLRRVKICSNMSCNSLQPLGKDIEVTLLSMVSHPLSFSKMNMEHRLLNYKKSPSHLMASTNVFNARVPSTIEVMILSLGWISP